jgi:hypothetical protein
MNIILNQFYSLKSNCFSYEYLNKLRNEILSCSYLEESQLSDSFLGTKGFSVIFKRSSLDQVEL